MVERTGRQSHMSNLSEITLMEGTSFCISSLNGDIIPGTTQGIFHEDTRILSQWQMMVDGQAIQTLQVLTPEPYHGTFICTAHVAHSNSSLVVRRERYIGEGMREDLFFDNETSAPVSCTVSLSFDSDFSDLHEVKNHQPSAAPDRHVSLNGEILVSSQQRERGTRIRTREAQVTENRITYAVKIPPRGSWHTTIHIIPVIDGIDEPVLFSDETELSQTLPAQRLRGWTESSLAVETNHSAFRRTLTRSLQDLAVLRLYEENSDEPPTIAAGSPWFMALFGRDSLLTSWMSLSLDNNLALGTLRRLASLQGTKEDTFTGEEPGKILHELRTGIHPELGVAGRAYYGTVDATPLFVMLLGELRRWGLHSQDVARLLPAADRALEWILTWGDPDQDGFVEYQHGTERHLLNQGWKDSPDAIAFADGSFAKAPIALAEVQGYVYAAFTARAHFAYEAGKEAEASQWEARAARIRENFNEQFWLPDKGYFAIGLDGEKRPIDSLASNMGHCLWTGIVDSDKAPLVRDALMSPEMFTGFGIRTLATNMGTYHPVSYHNGSVWPHDNAIIAAGFMRYGFVEEAQAIAEAILDAADHFNGRLPELFSGFDRRTFPVPIPYPTSCSPQAWAAATPIQLLRTLLRLDPSVPTNALNIAPAFPAGFDRLHLSRVHVNGARLDIALDGDDYRVGGLPTDMELIRKPAHG